MKAFFSSSFLSILLLLATALASHGKRNTRFASKKRCKKGGCPVIRCAPDHISFIPTGKCCPSCKPTLDCSAVKCAACVKDEISIFGDGECCPKCEPQKLPDCSLVRCAQPVCSEGYEPVKAGCCETCQLKPNCEIVQCITAPCPPICTGGIDPMPCPLIKCAAGYEAQVLKGERCPTCQPVDVETKQPCRMVSCLDPCYSLSSKTDANGPICAEDQQCVTEMVYITGNGDHCPPTGCPHFVECK